MPTIITNIKQLVNVREENKLLRGKELAELPVIDNAYLVIENGLIKDFGEMKDLQILNIEQGILNDEVINEKQETRNTITENTKHQTPKQFFNYYQRQWCNYFTNILR